VFCASAEIAIVESTTALATIDKTARFTKHLLWVPEPRDR
jgi:hypothetical protein